MTIVQNPIVILWIMVNFSSETIEDGRKTKFQVLLGKKNLAIQNAIPNKLSFRKEGNINSFSEGNRVCQYQTYPKRVARESSLSRKQMINERTLQYQEGRKNTVNKSNRLFFSWLLKIIFHCWKNIILTLSDVILHM